MKKKTKIKVVAVASGCAISSFVATNALLSKGHPAMWATAIVTIISFVIAGFVGITIED